MFYLTEDGFTSTVLKQPERGSCLYKRRRRFTYERLYARRDVNGSIDSTVYSFGKSPGNRGSLFRVFTMEKNAQDARRSPDRRILLDQWI